MAVHLDRWSTATAVFQDRARVKPETAADAMSLQKREVAKDDRAQEGSITLDRKTRKRSRVIACMGKFAAAIRSRIRRTPLPAQKRAGAFFSQFVYRQFFKCACYSPCVCYNIPKQMVDGCAPDGDGGKTRSRAVRRIVII